MLDAQIDLKHGRKTRDDLVAQRKLYEGGHAMLTSLVSEESEPGPMKEAFCLLYRSICLVLRMLLASFPHLFEDDARDLGEQEHV